MDQLGVACLACERMRGWSRDVPGSARPPRPAVFEIAVAALKASGNPKDGAAVASAIGSLKGQAITGDYDFTSGPVPHVSQVPELVAQWRLVSGSPQLVVINNSLLPAVPVAGSLQLL